MHFSLSKRRSQIFVHVCMYVCVYSSVQDKSIATSIPVLDLIDSIQPQSVNFDLVKTEDPSDEDKLDNAK